MKLSNAEPVQVIHYRIDKWYASLEKDVLLKIHEFYKQLLAQNKSNNLISVVTIPNADLVHFADCIEAVNIVKHLNLPIDEIYDLGSGNGLPGVIFAILNKNSKVILVDSDQRKVEFLRHIKTTLNLTNIEIKFAKVESIPDNSIKFAISRDFASIQKSILITRKAFVKGGLFFHMKSEEWGSEIMQIPTQLCTYWLPGLVKEYKLPLGEVKFAVVKTEKI